MLIIFINFVDYVKDLEGQLSSLKLRAESTERSASTTEQSENLSDNVIMKKHVETLNNEIGKFHGGIVL